jgi:flagellar basal-body rod protein FlgC
MDLNKTMMISASGMRAQSRRLRVISENLANTNSTSRMPGGEPYRRKVMTFRTELDRNLGVELVKPGKVTRDPTEFSLKYDPAHPAADANGYVKLPNVNGLIEMMDMREAQRGYEANLKVIEAARGMLKLTIEALRG